MPLTGATCKNVRCLEGKARERYADSGGLYLEAIGTYPAVTLAQARQARDDARKKLLDRQPSQASTASTASAMPMRKRATLS